MNANAKDTLWQLVNDVTFCMFVTWDGEAMRSRPMTLKSDESAGEFQFLAAQGSTTVAEIESNPLVNLAFAEPEEMDYVSVSGHAALSEDRELIAELWSPYAQKYFGEGPETAEVVVIRVTPHRAEYWDGESHSAKSVWNFIKAHVGDGKAPTAEHATVNF